MCCYLAYFQDIPGCGKFKKHPLQNEDELTTCFQGIVNVGADHWSPCGTNAAMAAAPTLGSVTHESTQDEGVAQAKEGAAQGVQKVRM